MLLATGPALALALAWGSLGLAPAPGLAEEPAPGSAVVPEVAAAEIAAVPNPAAVPAADSEPAAVSPPGAAAPPASAGKDRMEALMRALYLLSTGGNSRPFPTMPAQ